jgi:hypothetical protein
MAQSTWPDRKQCPECTAEIALTASLEFAHVSSSRDPTDCRGAQTETESTSLWRREAVLAELAEAYWDPVQWYWRAILPADTAAAEKLVQEYDLTALDHSSMHHASSSSSSPRIQSLIWICLLTIIGLVTAACCCYGALRLHKGEWTSNTSFRRTNKARGFSQSDAAGFEDNFKEEGDEGGPILLEIVTSIHKFLNRRKRSRSGESPDLEELKV